MKIVTKKIHNYKAYKSLMKNVPQRWGKPLICHIIVLNNTPHPNPVVKNNKNKLMILICTSVSEMHKNDNYQQFINSREINVFTLHSKI